MPVCVVPVQATVGGAYMLALAPERTDLSTCTYIIEDGAANAWRELGNMSLENAAQVGSMVGVVWAIAWGFRQLVRTVRTTDSDTE